MGDLLGLQADVAATELNGAAAMGGALHLFTRNPDAYLLGAIGGIAASENASTAWLGGEAELYLENISFEVSAGYLNVKPDAGSHRDELFASGDIAFYPVDNLKMSLGASSVAGFESANARFEYLFETTPVSMSLSGQLGEDLYKAVSVGVSFYFGGSDASKSLKRRHREDDPRNRVLDILNSGAAVLAKSPLTAPVDPEAACNAIPDHSWVDGVCRDYSNARLSSLIVSGRIGSPTRKPTPDQKNNNRAYYGTPKAGLFSWSIVAKELPQERSRKRPCDSEQHSKDETRGVMCPGLQHAGNHARSKSYTNGNGNIPDQVLSPEESPCHNANDCTK